MILPIIDFSVHAHLSSLHKTIKSINIYLEGITTGEVAANSDCEILATYRRVSSKSSQLKLIYFLDRGENSNAMFTNISELGVATQRNDTELMISLVGEKGCDVNYNGTLLRQSGDLSLVDICPDTVL